MKRKNITLVAKNNLVEVTESWSAIKNTTSYN